MRKFFITLLTVSVFGLGGALAQVTTEPFDDDFDVGNEFWGGVSLGVPFGVNFHFGVEDLLAEGVDLRTNLSAGFAGLFGVGADVLFDLPIDTADTPIDVYAGGGLAVAFGNIDRTTPEMETAFGLGLMVGGEYRLIDAGLPEGGIFAELGPAIGFGAGPAVTVNAKLGFNYHF
jgi:hypothetical protein